MGVTKKHKQIVSVCQLTSIKYAKIIYTIKVAEFLTKMSHTMKILCL